MGENCALIVFSIAKEGGGPPSLLAMAMAIPVMMFQVWGCKISIWNYSKSSKKSIVNSNTVPSLYCTWHFMCVEMRN